MNDFTLFTFKLYTFYTWLIDIMSRLDANYSILTSLGALRHR